MHKYIPYILVLVICWAAALSVLLFSQPESGACLVVGRRPAFTDLFGVLRAVRYPLGDGGSLSQKGEADGAVVGDEGFHKGHTFGYTTPALPSAPLRRSMRVR